MMNEIWEQGIKQHPMIQKHKENCEQCGLWEIVEHVFLMCPRYQAQRFTESA